ncbi:MAG TPA: heparan-alpha-glucosaminide N-acetyltransferase domain-containing protein [Telluria sp.]|nr:heparan-alpha-glucosaminide N-acetyltransferase domain-containing protein [Telluria sp.]
MTHTQGRLASLDAFRGFSIAAMVLVNNPGDWSNLYGQLEHAHWNGWTFTDWIFPFFLFIGGVSMALSLGRLAEAGADKPALLRKLAKRALLIFLVGFLLNLIPNFNWAAVRIPGVLQRIALCTLLAAPIVVVCSWRQQLAWIAALLAGYSVLMLAVPVPVPGIGAGVLEPGKDVGAWVDRMLLGGHLWVQSKTWDPEGLVSTIPALCSQLFGVLAGRWLLSRVGRTEQTVWMLLAGLLLLWLGAILDSVLMPINKSLWTTSFCLFMTGWALVVFSAFYWLLDVNPHAAVRAAAARWCRPFIIYGMNALFIFALSGLIAKMLGFIKFTQPDGSKLALGRLLYAPIRDLPIAPVNTSLLYAVLFNGLMFGIAWLMWRNKWFVKV